MCGGERELVAANRQHPNHRKERVAAARKQAAARLGGRTLPRVARVDHALVRHVHLAPAVLLLVPN
eukprot:6645003-Prymnesium_polylepis.1